MVGQSSCSAVEIPGVRGVGVGGLWSNTRMGIRTVVADRAEMWSDVGPESAGGVLAAARASRAAADREEANLCRLAVEWVVMHPGDALGEAAT